MIACIDFRAVAEEFLGTHPASNVYFLLDHGGLPGLHRQLLRGSAEWVSLFDGTQEASALAVAPFLVLVGRSGRLQMSRSLFEWIGEHGTYSSSVIILASPLEIDFLRLRLAARLNVRLSEEMDALLRFFDPRVFEGLTKILSPEQAAPFFGFAEGWIYVNREGRLISFASSLDYKGEASEPLQLSQEQEGALLVESEIDQVIGLLENNLPQLMGGISAANKFELINSVMHEARAGGLDTILKISLCEAIALNKGKDFIEEGGLNRLIAELRQENCNFFEVISKIQLMEK